MRRQPGRLGYHRAVQVPHTPPVLFEYRTYLAQQSAAVDAAIAWVGIRKMMAYVAKRGSTQAGVADRMDQHVGIGVAVQDLGMRNFDSAKTQVTPRFQRVDVVVMSDTYQSASAACLWR